MELTTRFSLLNFLKSQRLFESATLVYFRVHEKQNEYQVLDRRQELLATTSRDAFLLFLTTYDCALVEEDAAGYQLWQLQLSSLDSPRESGSVASSFIRR